MPNSESVAQETPKPVKKPRVKSTVVLEAVEPVISFEKPEPKYRQQPKAKLRTRPKAIKPVILPSQSIISEPLVAEPVVSDLIVSEPQVTESLVTEPIAREPLEVNMEIKRIVEAILFAANKPMSAKQVQQVFPELEQPELSEIQTAIDSIAEEYQTRPVELRKIASGYRFQVKAELSRWVSRLFDEKPPRYSRALLETLAIIAYRQPVTRGEIEDIRGVSVSSSIIQTLLEREWVRVVAHKEVPGRPGLYGTTKEFLDYFNISTLTELPTLQEVQTLDLSLENTQQPMQVASERQEDNEQNPTEQVSEEDVGDSEAISETVA